VPESRLVGLFGPSGPEQPSQEEGAAAIQNIANFYDWDEGASRIIFFLGDEGLHEGNPQDDHDVDAANKAIEIAKMRNVTVHMYFGSPNGPRNQDTIDDYKRVARETGGSFFSEETGDFNRFQEVLQEVICSGIKVCKPAEIPELLPCFKLRWGDGPKDQIETTDTECLCITACNRYANVTFKDLIVIISEVTKGGAPVPNLPDGTPSVFIKPSKFICFGDLGPCTPNDNPNEPDQLSCISRELVLVSSGALEGEYLLKIEYCYSVHFDLNGKDEFKLQLYAS
jgi:(2Fe-2S) ferredoxin